MRIKAQRGFIQIPILIAVLLGIAVLGGTGYIAYEVGQKSSKNTSALPTPTSSNISQIHLTTTVEISTSTKQVEAKKEPTATHTLPPVISALPVSSNMATNYCNGKSYNACQSPKIFNCPKNGEGQCINPSADIYCATDGAYYTRSICPAGQFLNCPTDGGQIRCVDSTKTTYCNGTYYNTCSSGQFYCPTSGKATCLTGQQGSSYLNSPASQLQSLNEQQKQNEANQQQKLQELEQEFLAKYKPCDDWLKQVDANVVAIKAEISAAGGFGTVSQIQVMAIQRAGNPPAQCGSSSSVYTSSYSSTHCDFLNGGLDCTSSGGARMQAMPIPGGSGFDIRSW